MCFVDQGGILALFRLPLGRVEFGHSHLLGILQMYDWSLSSIMACKYY